MGVWYLVYKFLYFIGLFFILYKIFLLILGDLGLGLVCFAKSLEIGDIVFFFI